MQCHLAVWEAMWAVCNGDSQVVLSKEYSSMLDLERQVKPRAAAYIQNNEDSGVLWK